MHCDLTRNVWVNQRFSYLHDKMTMRCLQRMHERVEPTYCRQSSFDMSPCNLETGKREIIHTTYTMEHCHCRRQERRILRPCGCHLPNSRLLPSGNSLNKAVGPAETKMNCDAEKGVLIARNISWTWNDEADRCVATREVTVQPVGRF
ncbi:unnamed protein product [Protopolystoma xenopodis]|uniref:Uncharacterized protein n=1 Tax=Protopolystoma xenopodis TaxID=117903 RepID=A0A3S5CM70_9PLAT|nr:unnamed protein product [Protopolystoma xenopodis]